jgi:hypothetical protein
MKQLPGVFALMSRKRSPPVAERLVADFEDRLWRAVKTVFPDVHIQGCAFHWGLAVSRHVQKLGLQVFPLIFFKEEYILKMFNVMRIGRFFDIIMIMKILVITVFE